jgi:RP/EB family microtubule-associated protein
MDGAFFVGRKEIVEWVNITLELSIQKVEDTAFGAVACQLLDIMHPGVVPMSKVNWGAKQNFEFVHNYKILQTSFTKLHIDKYIDVDRLITARYMDNLEFMQWFKRYYEMHVTDKGDYDCVAQRCKGKGGRDYMYGGGGAGTRRSGGAAATSRTTAGTARASSSGSARAPAPARAQKENTLPASTSTSKVGSSSTVKKSGSGASSTSAPRSTKATGSSSAVAAEYEAELKTLRASNDEQKQAYEDLRLEMEGLEKERDFYFDKLREVEILLQDLEDQGKSTEETQAIFNILYATAEGFEPAGEGNDDGEFVDEDEVVEGEAAERTLDETY